MEVVHRVLLAGHTGQRAIDENLPKTEALVSIFVERRRPFCNVLESISDLEDMASCMDQAALPKLLVSSVGILHHV